MALTYSLNLTLVSCPACGISYGIPDDLNDRALEARRSHSLYCPNGHSWHYTGKSDEQKRAEAAEARAREAEHQRDAARKTAAIAREQRETAERRARALKGHATRLRHRIAAGKCPQCSADFPDLAAHYAEVHPGAEAPE